MEVRYVTEAYPLNRRLRDAMLASEATRGLKKMLVFRPTHNIRELNIPGVRSLPQYRPAIGESTLDDRWHVDA